MSRIFSRRLFSKIAVVTGASSGIGLGAVLGIDPSLGVQRGKFYSPLFKAGDETVKEISFDTGLSLPALS